MANWAKCEEKAQEVLRKNDVDEPYVDVFKIAKTAEIEIKPSKFKQEYNYISGFLNKNGTKPIIYVNADEDARRQNFTIAHELGHYFLEHQPDHWGINRRDSAYFGEKDEYEKEADYFAAYLLMPENLLKKSMREYKLDKDDYLILADMFGVSATAMKHRLNFLERRHATAG